jgi:hypothetical protein
MDGLRKAGVAAFEWFVVCVSESDMECGTRSCRFRASRGLRAPTGLRKAVAALVPRCATALQMGGVRGFGTLRSRRGRERVRYGVRHAKLPLSSAPWHACANRPAESGSCARASLRDRTPNGRRSRMVRTPSGLPLCQSAQSTNGTCDAWRPVLAAGNTDAVGVALLQ